MLASLLPNAFRPTLREFDFKILSIPVVKLKFGFDSGAAIQVNAPLYCTVCTVGFQDCIALLHLVWLFYLKHGYVQKKSLGPDNTYILLGLLQMHSLI